LLPFLKQFKKLVRHIDNIYREPFSFAEIVRKRQRESACAFCGVLGCGYMKPASRRQDALLISPRL